MIRRYLIQRPDMECECPECGWPSDIGSFAWEWEDDNGYDGGYCGKECALAAKELAARNAAGRNDA